MSGGSGAEEETKMKENDQKIMNINFRMDSNQRREAYNGLPTQQSSDSGHNNNNFGGVDP